MPKSYDVVVIGAGIVGLATARALLQKSSQNILVLEAEAKPAAHQTGNNSGVIHSGLYYRPGSLKASNCTRGREMMIDYCREKEIPFDRCGKVVVATDETEIPKLEELQKRGDANGLRNMSWLNPKQLAQHEPYCQGVAALHIRETGIVDYSVVCGHLAQDLRDGGATVQTLSRVTHIDVTEKGIEVCTDRDRFRTRGLVNCAGLHSDRIATMSGLETPVKIIPFRGEYYRLKPEAQGMVRHLIYPVPDPRFPFLGVHFTRMIGGGVEAGPNAVLAWKREGYRWRDISLRDLSDSLSYPGFWKMARKYWRTGMGEVHRSLRKKAFVQALRKLLPELQVEDVEPHGAGVRAQALDKEGNLIDDFSFVDADRMVHVLNAPSPAATASLSIGETVADRFLANS